MVRKIEAFADRVSLTKRYAPLLSAQQAHTRVMEQLYEFLLFALMLLLPLLVTVGLGATMYQKLQRKRRSG